MARRETPDDVMQRLAEGEPIQFVDARSQKSWEGSTQQAPGSIRIPPDQVDDHHRALPARGRPIVTYCT